MRHARHDRCVCIPYHFLMRKLLIAIVIAAVFGGGWGLLYFIVG